MPTIPRAHLTIALLLAATPSARGQAPDLLEAVLPGVRRLADVPTLASVVGHDFGARITDSEETVRYARALAAASPRIELFEHGRSVEGRPLVHLVISAPANLAALDANRAGMQRLADPRGVAADELDRLCDELRPVTWLGYSVHGDEISCTDAGLALAWHLASADGDPLVDRILGETIVVLDPLLNPDGRARFVFHARQTRGRAPDASLDAAERDQPWPGGRVNHNLCDMNRDWFGCTQPETRARVRLFQQWWPVAAADVHEMGSGSTYYFGPPAKPHNPELPESWFDWQTRYGRNNAAWFDRLGYEYFTRETFDAFYPGYGDTWPGLHGAVSVTFEESSVRGLVVTLEDDTTRTFAESVRHHFVASLATAETTANDPSGALRRLREHRSTAIATGRAGPVQEYVIESGRDPWRAGRLAASLAFQGIEVDRLTAAATNPLARPHTAAPDTWTPRTFAAGSYVVRLDQPSKRLAVALLAADQPMDAGFVAEQLRRHERREAPEIYDITGWSLPLLFGVDCFATAAFTDGPRERVAVADLEPPTPDPARATDGPTPQVAWLLPAGSNATARVAAGLLRAGLSLRCAGRPFRIGERHFAAGSWIVPSRALTADQHALVRAWCRAHGLDALPVDSSWVDEGIDFGSDRAPKVRAPRIALAWDEPTRATAAGSTRQVLEDRHGLPVVEIRTRRLARADLADFDVVVLPDGGDYADVLGAGGAARLRDWVRAGGTLVTLGGGATRWLVADDVGLLAASPEPRAAPPEADDAGEPDDGDGDGDDAAEPDAPAAAFDYARAILPEREDPARTPGAILRVELDPEHWLAFGLGTAVDVVGLDRTIYAPIKLDLGRNVGVYARRDALLRSGFAWPDKLDQLASKPYLVHQPHGDGHVVAFAEDPTLRGFVEGTDLLLLNAVLLGPAF